jgi:hypothetical protein
VNRTRVPPNSNIANVYAEAELDEQDLDTPRPAGEPSTRLADQLIQSSLFLCLLIIVLYNSHILSLFDLSAAEIAINRSLYVVAFVGLMTGVFRIQIAASLASIFLFAYFVFLIFEFTYTSRSVLGEASELGFSPLYSRIQLLCVPMIAALTGRGRGWRLEYVVYTVSIIYLALYIYCSLIIAPSAASTFRASALIADYDERGTRIALDNAITSLALFISLANFSKAKPIAVIVFLLSCAAVYLSSSRYYQFCVVVTIASYLISRNIGRTATVMAMVFIAVCTIFFSQVMSGQNPFTFIAGDRSLAARAASYEAVEPLVQSHVRFGVGLADTPESDMRMAKLSPFFWTDLGMVGVLYVGGILGLGIFLGMSLMCFFSPALLRRAQIPPGMYIGLCLAAACTAFYGIIAPTLWYNGLEVFIFVLGVICARR